MRKNLWERQTTKKGSKIDIIQLDAEELKKNLEEKLGTELTWDDYSWTAEGEFAGCKVKLNFIESDKGNKYELSYSREGSIHNRSVWEDDNMEDFDRDVDQMIVELGDYGDTPAEEEDSDLEDDFESEEAEDDYEDNGEEELDFGESFKPLRDSFKKRQIKESEAGHFQSLENELRNFQLITPPGLDPVFTNNGFYDLEKRGLSGYGVWVGYRHGRTGASLVSKAKKLKSFVYGSVVDAIEDYLESIGVPGTVVVEDKIDTTDMYRIYIVTEE